MWNPAQRQRRKISQDLTRPPVIEPSPTSRASKSRDNLEVDQLRRGELFPAEAPTDAIAISAIIR